MDRPFFTDIASEHSGLAMSQCKWTAGTSGAVGTIAYKRGIASIVKPSGTGLYDITFNKPGVKNFMVSGSIEQATYDATHACQVVTISDNLATTGVIRVGTVTGAGVLANMTSGDVIKLTFDNQWNAANS